MSADQVVLQVLLLMEQPVRKVFFDFVTTSPDQRRQTFDYNALTSEMTYEELAAITYIMTGDEFFVALDGDIDQADVALHDVYHFFALGGFMTDAQMRAYKYRKSLKAMQTAMKVFDKTRVGEEADQQAEKWLSLATAAVARADRERGEEDGRIVRLEKM